MPFTEATPSNVKPSILFFVYTRPFAVAVTLCVFLTISTPALAFKVGILLPTTGPNQTLGDEVRAGAKFAAQSLNLTQAACGNINAVYPTAWDGNDIQAGLDHLLDKDVDVLIAGATPDSSKQFREYVTSLPSPLVPPTILLSDPPGAWRYGDNQQFPAQYHELILRLGISQEQYYVNTLRHWITNLGIQNIAVVYDTISKETSDYDEALISEVVRDNDRITVVPVIAEPTSHYDDLAAKLISHNPEAIVLAGQFFNEEALLNDIREDTDAPVYLSRTPNEWQISQFSKMNLDGIYYGYPWLFDVTNTALEEVREKVNKELGWHSRAFSPLAVKTYEALNVSYSACNSWKSLRDFSDSQEPWKAFEGTPIEGLPSAMILETIHGTKTMVGPLHFYKITAGTEGKLPLTYYDEVGGG